MIKKTIIASIALIAFGFVCHEAKADTLSDWNDMTLGASATVKEAVVATTGITFWFEDQAKQQRAQIKNHTAEQWGNGIAHTAILAQGAGGVIQMWGLTKLKNKILGLEELAARLENANKSLENAKNAHAYALKSHKEAIIAKEEAIKLQGELITEIKKTQLEASEFARRIEEKLDLNIKFMLEMSQQLEP